MAAIERRWLDDVVANVNVDASGGAAVASGGFVSAGEAPPPTGGDDTATLQAFIDAQANGTALAPTIIKLAAGQTYRIDTGLVCTSRSYLTFDLNGATLQWNSPDNDNARLLLFTLCTGIRVQNGTLLGTYAYPASGDAHNIPFQHMHAVHADGSDVTLTGSLAISGFYGDGIYYGNNGSTLATGAVTSTVDIRKVGRNGVSIVGGDSITLAGAYQQCGFSWMDFEPNASTNNQRVTNVTVDGAVFGSQVGTLFNWGVVLMPYSGGTNSQIADVTFQNCTSTTLDFYVRVGNSSPTGLSRPQRIKFRNNHCSAGQASWMFEVYHVDTLDITGNDPSGGAAIAHLGDNTDVYVTDSTYDGSGNQFRNAGALGPGGVLGGGLDRVVRAAGSPIRPARRIARIVAVPSVAAPLSLDASGGTASATGSASVLSVTLTASTGAASADGGDATVTSVQAVAPIVIAPGHTGNVIRAATVPPPPRQRAVSSIIGGLVPTVPSGANVDATGGSATAAGTGSTLTVTLTASSGTAIASGGTVTSGGANFTADTGTATASGSTASLTVTLTASTGAATASGGDTSVSVAQAPQPVVYGPGRSGTAVRAGTTPLPLRRVRVSILVAGITPSIDANLNASGGAATATGGDTSVSFPVVGLPPGPMFIGSTPGVVRAPRKVQPYTPPAAGTRVYAYAEVPVSPAASADGGTAGLSFTYTAASAAATAAGGSVTESHGAGASVTATGGTATAAGGTDTLAFTWTASTGTASGSGGTAALTAAFTATTGTASASGGTDSLAFTYLASSGTATGAGGTVVFGGGADLTATSGTATAGGGTDTVRFTYLAAAGAATAAGGIVNFGNTVTLPATNGSATGTGGTSLVTFVWTSTAGTATGTGGTVVRVNPATGGMASTGGAVALRWILPVVAGNATAGGGTVTGFVPTFGHIDGLGGTVNTDETLSGLTASVEASSGLATAIG